MSRVCLARFFDSEKTGQTLSANAAQESRVPVTEIWAGRFVSNLAQLVLRAPTLDRSKGLDQAHQAPFLASITRQAQEAILQFLVGFEDAGELRGDSGDIGMMDAACCHALVLSI